MTSNVYPPIVLELLPIGSVTAELLQVLPTNTGGDILLLQQQVNTIQTDLTALTNEFNALPPITYQQDFLNTNSIVVTHNMQKKPAVYIEDTGGNVWVPTKINHTTLNTLDVQFDTVFSGTIFLS